MRARDAKRRSHPRAGPTLRRENPMSVGGTKSRSGCESPPSVPGTAHRHFKTSATNDTQRTVIFVVRASRLLLMRRGPHSRIAKAKIPRGRKPLPTWVVNGENVAAGSLRAWPLERHSAGRKTLKGTRPHERQPASAKSRNRPVDRAIRALRATLGANRGAWRDILRAGDVATHQREDKRPSVSPVTAGRQANQPAASSGQCPHQEAPGVGRAR